VKVRTLVLTYFVAFAAGAAYKLLLYLIQPESFTHINSAVIELTIVSALVTAGVAIFYMLRQKRKLEDEK